MSGGRETRQAHRRSPGGPTLRLVGVAVGFMIGIAAVGVLGYTYYLDELYPPPPPETPEPLEGPVARMAERVVIVVFDSTREDLMNEPTVMPNLAALAAGGRRGVSIAQPVTMTLLSVLNFSTGRTPGLAWSVHNFQADTFPDESIFYWAHARGLRAAFTGDAAWAQLFGHWAAFDRSFADGGMYDQVDGLLARKDHEAIATAHTLLGATDPGYDLIVVHLISTDHVAHATGALTRDPQTGALTLYAETAFACDAAFGELYARYRRPGDTWLALSDHGATDTGNHGGGEDITRRAPFVVAGAGIVPGPPVEITLNAWAPTLSLLLGLPIPRTAEQPAAFELLALDAVEREAAFVAHAARRREFVGGIARSLGAEEDLVQAHERTSGAGLSPAEQALADSNAFVRDLRQHRRWLQVLGLALGAVLHLLVLFLLMSRSRGAVGDGGLDRDDVSGAGRWSWGVFAAVAAVWLMLMSVPLAFDTWLFKFAEVLGHATESLWKLGRGAIYVTAGTGLAVLAAQRTSRWRGAQADEVRLGLSWLVFAAVALATSQMVVKWPFGPLAEVYLTIFAWAAVCGGVWVWRRGRLRGPWVLGALGVAWMIGVFVATGDENLQLMAETAWSKWLTLAASSAAVIALLVTAWRRESDGRARWTLVAASVSLLLALVAYRLEPTPLGARVSLLALLAAAMATLALRQVALRSRRDALFALAIALAHVMSSDWIALMTLGLLAVVYALSEVPMPARSWTPAVVAGTIGLLDIGYFYVCGYRYSFTAMDVRVVFMLDQTQIDLVSGFFLMTLQHSPVWLLLWASALANRLAADDHRGLRTAFLAVVAVFLIRTWGPYFAMEYKILNHWYVSHAVPMFIMSTVECAVATLWFALSLLSLRGVGVLMAPARQPRSCAGERPAESAAGR